MIHFRSLLRKNCAAVLTLLTVCAAPAVAEDWLEMADDEFAWTFGEMAFDPDQRDLLAWRLLARVNRRIDTPFGTVSQWQLWPSDSELFSKNFQAGDFPQAPSLEHMSVSKATMFDPTKGLEGAADNEEVTHNPLEANYILENGLVSKAGFQEFFTTQANPYVDVPVGSIEVKAKWAPYNKVEHSDQAVTYTFEDNKVMVLTGFHIMAKLWPLSSDPFNSPEPSWFWTTFEFMGNPGLENVQSLMTFPDTAPQFKNISLEEAGLGGSNWMNYSSNGTQHAFVEASSNAPVFLGNSTMEAFAGRPKTKPETPENWTAMFSSCHSCHAQAAFDIVKGDFASAPSFDQRMSKEGWNFNTDGLPAYGNLAPVPQDGHLRSLDFIYGFQAAIKN